MPKDVHIMELLLMLPLTGCVYSSLQAGHQQVAALLPPWTPATAAAQQAALGARAEVQLLPMAALLLLVKMLSAPARASVPRRRRCAAANAQQLRRRSR